MDISFNPRRMYFQRYDQRRATSRHSDERKITAENFTHNQRATPLFVLLLQLKEFIFIERYYLSAVRRSAHFSGRRASSGNTRRFVTIRATANSESSRATSSEGARASLNLSGKDLPRLARENRRFYFFPSFPGAPQRSPPGGKEEGCANARDAA